MLRADSNIGHLGVILCFATARNCHLCWRNPNLVGCWYNSIICTCSSRKMTQKVVGVATHCGNIWDFRGHLFLLTVLLSDMERKSVPHMHLSWHFCSEVGGNIKLSILFSLWLLNHIKTLLSEYSTVLTLSHNFSLKDKLKAIAKATYTHSRNLAYFVSIYKGLQALQVKIQGKSLQSQSFLAACLGGWLVFGDNNNINSQVRGWGVSVRLSPAENAGSLLFK